MSGRAMGDGGWGGRWGWGTGHATHTVPDCAMEGKGCVKVPGDTLCLSFLIWRMEVTAALELLQARCDVLTWEQHALDEGWLVAPSPSRHRPTEAGAAGPSQWWGHPRGAAGRREGQPGGAGGPGWPLLPGAMSSSFLRGHPPEGSAGSPLCHTQSPHGGGAGSFRKPSAAALPGSDPTLNGPFGFSFLAPAQI